MDNLEARSFLEKTFGTLFDPRSTTEQMLGAFDPEYVQDLNGKVYSRREFLDGVLEMKRRAASIQVQFTTVVSSGDVIAEAHVVQVVEKDGSRRRFKVMAFQTVGGGRIQRVEEVNCPLM